MLHDVASVVLRGLSGPPAFQVYGRGRREADWHVLDVYATHRRDRSGRLPLWRGTCITWTSRVIAVGWDFAAVVLAEQARAPASRERPVVVAGGRLRDWRPRVASGASSQPSASEVLAHEIGHTAQARRMGLVYWPLGGAVTLFREGPHWWNHFENQASATGLFGGIVNGSVSAELLRFAIG
ncbi:MAG TPA: hypothetical protein VL371_21020 [Gemmataceae bacterium]|jgi:hypothetical protein|nr:hypothetical protein [Gemmataceae bacterium]